MFVGLLSSLVTLIHVLLIEFLAYIVISVNDISSVAGMVMSLELPGDINGIFIATLPFWVVKVMSCCVEVVAAAVVVVVSVVVVVQLVQETDVENAFEVSPNCKLMVALELVPPTVTVHESVVDDPAAIVVLELEVGSPLHVNPLGHVSV